MDPLRVVRSGYDAVAARYLEARLRGVSELPLVEELFRRVPAGRLVLDAGCGAGIPLTSGLAQRYRVLGVDFSISQLRLAARLVPSALFICQDLTALGVAPSSLDAVCSFYAIIHIPRDKHRRVLEAIHRAIKPAGHALLCLGAEDLPQDLGEYQGAPMFWSHFDAQTYHLMLTEMGFSILQAVSVPDPIDRQGSHLFVLAQKRAD
jgi:SAM-dependent methyltransferase